MTSRMVVWCHTLTFRSLFQGWRAARRSRSGDVQVYYDSLALLFRLMKKVCRGRTERCISLIGSVFGLKIAELPPDDVVPGYSTIFLKSELQVADILRVHLESFSSSEYAPGLASLLGEDCARSYYLKLLADEQLIMFIVGTNVLTSLRGPEVDLRIVMPPDLNHELTAFVAQTMQLEDSILLVQKPSRLFGRLARTLIFLMKSGLVAGSLLRRGIARSPKSARRFKMASELVDLSRFSGKPGEPDFLVDGDSLRDEDMLYYVTEHQYRRYIRKAGVDRRAIRRMAARRRAEVVFIDELPVPWRCWKALARAWAAFLRQLWRGAVGDFDSWLTTTGLRQFGEYSALFYHYGVQTHILVTHPQGHTVLRKNSGLVTGVCRRYAVSSVGYQTRFLVSRRYEYCFESLDLLCMWGEGHQYMLKPYLSLVKRVVFVGDVFLDTLLPLMRAAAVRPKTVLIIPGDVTTNHYQTYGVAIEFMTACCDAALSLPGVEFIVRVKRPAHVPMLQESPELRQKLSALSGRFLFPDIARFDTEELISQAEVVVAIGFTTPGIDAILAGKKGVYFDGLRFDTEILTDVPDVVVHSGDELTETLRRLLDGPTGPRDCESALSPLDPFRDGMARSRILSAISELPQGPLRQVSSGTDARETREP